MDEEKILVGSDGKEVSRKVPKFIATKRWYEDENTECPAQKRPHSDYAVKRDPYAKYDTADYEQVVNKFASDAPARQVITSAPDKPIVDEYSKVIATTSKRDLKDYAHYLEDIPKLEFAEDDKDVPSRSDSKIPISDDSAAGLCAKDSHFAAAAAESDKFCLAMSDYAEDVFANGHTSVYGSYYNEGKWGYKCCKLLDFGVTCPHES